MTRLVAKALATPSGKYNDRAAAIQKSSDGSFLFGEEMTVLLLSCLFRLDKDVVLPLSTVSLRFPSSTASVVAANGSSSPDDQPNSSSLILANQANYDRQQCPQLPIVGVRALIVGGDLLC
jgi:hypothetical protein